MQRLAVLAKLSTPKTAMSFHSKNQNFNHTKTPLELKLLAAIDEKQNQLNLTKSLLANAESTSEYFRDLVKLIKKQEKEIWKKNILLDPDFLPLKKIPGEMTLEGQHATALGLVKNFSPSLQAHLNKLNQIAYAQLMELEHLKSQLRRHSSILDKEHAIPDAPITLFAKGNHQTPSQRLTSIPEATNMPSHRKS